MCCEKIGLYIAFLVSLYSNWCNFPVFLSRFRPMVFPKNIIFIQIQTRTAKKKFNYPIRNWNNVSEISNMNFYGPRLYLLSISCELVFPVGFD